MRTKNKAFFKIGFIALIVIVSVFCVLGFSLNGQKNTYADDIPFALYKNGVKVDFKNGEYFVMGTSEGLSLVITEQISENIQVTVDGEECSFSSDNKTVDLSELEGIVELSVTIFYDEPVTYAYTISIGWTELNSVKGVYYLPSENGWVKGDEESLFFKSQEEERLTSSTMRIVTKGVEYLSFSVISLDSTNNWDDNVVGNVYSSKTSFNVNGLINGTSKITDNDYTTGSFVLDYSIDVVTFKHAPKSSGLNESAEMTIKSLSVDPEYVNVNATFNSYLGCIYYFNSKGEKVVLSEGDNKVLKNLKASLYFESAMAEDNVMLFDYFFKCGSYSTNEESFPDGTEAHSLNVYVQADSTLKATFKVMLTLPQNTSSINVKQNGTFSLMSVTNGETYYFDREIPTEVTLMAPSLGVQETCKLYINGILHTEIVSAANTYAYTFGELDYDRTFTFVYTKEGDYQSTQFEYTLRKITTKTIEEDLISEESASISLVNDESFPYSYYSPISQDRVGYIPGNTGIYNSLSTITFTVYESGSFVFNYYMNTDDDTYCWVSVGAPVDFSSLSFSELDNLYGIGEAYSTYDKVSASHGAHGWRKKSVEVEVSGESCDVYIYYIKTKPYDSYVDSTEGLFGIADISYYVGNATYTQSLRFENSGSFTATVDGNILENGATFPVGTSVTLCATPSDGNIFYGWIINGELVSDEREYTFVLVKDSLVECVMQELGYYVAKDGNNFYETLNKAVTTSSESRTIYLINDFTLVEDLVIPANIKILIPYDEEDIEGFELGTKTTAGVQVSWANPQKYLYLTLTIKSGVSLVINGDFVLGGVLFYPDQTVQGYTSGAYSQIVNDGTIILDSGAYLDVNGLITGSGEIIANAKSTINMPFIVNNFAGGSITLSYYLFNCFPFNNYALINIQCNYTLNYQAKLVGAAALYFSEAINTQDIVIINSVDQRNENLDGSLYWITEGGSITLSYENKSVNAQMGLAHIEDSGVTTLTFHGNILIGEFFMQGFGSTEMILGLPYTFKYVVADDGVLTVPEGREYMLLPGAEMYVNEGGVLDIDGGLYVLDGLIQAPLGKKYYPTIEQLRKSGFAVSGMFINNGTTNINGGFAGIAQSTSSGAIINVSDNAVLSKTIEVGGEYGDNSSRAGLTLSAKVSGIKKDELSAIEKGNSYKSYSLSGGTEFSLPSFTMDYANECSELTGILNQKMSGSYGIVNGDKVEVLRTLSIGASVSNVVVRVNDGIYQTDENGEFSLMLPINVEISYQSTLLDKLSRSVNSWDDLSTIMIVIPKSVEGEAVGNNELIYNADGSVKAQLAVKGIVSFYNGDSEQIDLTYTLSDGYVQEVTFASDAYVIDYSDKVYIQKATLTAYLEEVLSLEYASDIIEKSTELYQQYNRLINGLSGEEVSYVSSKISSECGEWANYQAIINTFTVSGVTYGDKEVVGEGTSLNGEKNAISLSVGSEYTVEGGNIYVTFTYSSDFNGIEYRVEKRSTASRKSLSVVAEEKSSVYGEEIGTLTAQVDGLVLGDLASDVFTLTKQSGSDVGEYDITIVKNGTKTAFYDITYYGAKYTITVKEIQVKLEANNVMFSKANTLKVNVDFGDYESIAYAINVLYDGKVVAQYANGVMKLSSGFSFAVGEYSLQAVNENDNYSLVQPLPCVYYVVDNKDYYLFDVNLENGSKIYNGNVEELAVSVKVCDTEEQVDSTVKVNGSKNYEIKNAGIYLISVEVEGYTYNTTYTIESKTLTVNWSEESYYYNGAPQSPRYTLDGVIDGDSVTLAVNSYTEADVYEIIPAIEVGNYVIDEESYTFVILPKDVTIKVNSSLDLRLSTIVEGARVFFSVTQTDSDIISSKIKYECYDIDGNRVFTVDENGIIGNVVEFEVGIYSVVAICTDSNYNATCIPASLNLVADNNYYTLDVKFDGANVTEKVYDGANVAVSVIVNVTETGESVTDVAIEYYVGNVKVNSIRNASDYVIKITVDSETDYIYNYKVTQRVIELEWTVDEYTYNGFEQKPEVRAVNLVDNDSLTLVMSDGEYVNAGSKSISVTSITGDDALNYKLPENKGITYEIEAMTVELYFGVYNTLYGKVEQTLSITEVECSDDDMDIDKIYYQLFDGEELIGSIREGEVALNRTLLVGEYILYPISLDSNYIINSEGISFSVVDYKNYYSVDLGIFALSKTYDGQEVVLNVTAKVAQTRKAVDYTVTVNGSERYSICKAGSYSIVISLLGGSFDYEYIIEKKTAQIGWGTADFIYNGSSQIPEVTVTNKGSDDVTVEINDFDSISAGFKSVSVKGLSGADKDNYKLSGGLSFTYTVKVLEVDLSFADLETYYGVEKEITYSVNKDIPDSLSSIISVDREEGLTVGSYSVNVEVINSNYKVNIPNVSYVIKPREITVLIDSKSTTYGDDELGLTASISGSLAYNDSESSLYELACEKGVDVGEYAIEGIAKNDNYNITFVKATYTVKARKLEFFVKDIDIVYGDDEKPLEAELKDGFSFAYGDSIDDVLILSREQGVNAGEYKITASSKNNANYNIAVISYTNPENSVYSIAQRELTITLLDKTAEDVEEYDDVCAKLSKDAYEITSGELLDGDQLLIKIVLIYQGKDVALSEDNFKDYYIAGEHTITLTYDNPDYLVTIVNGKLTVTKARVNVVGIVTDYIYDDGNAIDVFNWKNNIEGNLKRADEKAFKVVVTNALGDEIEKITDAGKYTLNVVINYQTYFEFVDGAITEYIITVKKKDISSSLVAIGIPEGGSYEYDPYANDIYAECTVNGVSYGYEILKDGVVTLDCLSVGDYSIKIWIEDINYEGEASFSWSVLAKDISNEITVSGLGSEFNVLGKFEVEFSLPKKYKNITLEVKYFNLDGEVSEISVGEYRGVATINDENYYGEKEITFKVIDNYDELFTRLQALLEECKEGNPAERFNTLSAIRLALKEINEEELVAVKSIAEYSVVLDALEEEFISYGNKVEDVANTARGNNLLLCIEMWNAFMIMAYMGIKQTL